MICFYMTTSLPYSIRIWRELFDITYNSFLLIIGCSIGIYIATILYTRIFGKRSFSKMSSFDFAMTVAVGSIIATCILSESISLLEGAIGLFMVYILQLSAAYLRRYKIFQKLIDNQPTLLMENGVMITENMKAVRVTEDDLRSKLRENNVFKLSEVRAVIFETTGDMSILHTKSEDLVDDWLFEDVQR